MLAGGGSGGARVAGGSQGVIGMGLTDFHVDDSALRNRLGEPPVNPCPEGFLGEVVTLHGSPLLFHFSERSRYMSVKITSELCHHICRAASPNILFIPLDSLFRTPGLQ